jgi:hypothetical protein
MRLSAETSSVLARNRQCIRQRCIRVTREIRGVEDIFERNSRRMRLVCPSVTSILGISFALCALQYFETGQHRPNIPHDASPLPTRLPLETCSHIVAVPMFYSIEG